MKTITSLFGLGVMAMMLITSSGTSLAGTVEDLRDSCVKAERGDQYFCKCVAVHIDRAENVTEETKKRYIADFNYDPMEGHEPDYMNLDNDPVWQQSIVIGNATMECLNPDEVCRTAGYCKE